MIRNCILCRIIFNDEDLLEDCRMANVLILCNTCYMDRIHSDA